MSSRGNVQSEKCPVGEIAARASVWSGKCQVGEVSVGELSSQGCVSRESVGRGNVQSGKCPDPVQHLYRGLLKTKTKKKQCRLDSCAEQLGDHLRAFDSEFQIQLHTHSECCGKHCNERLDPNKVCRHDINIHTAQKIKFCIKDFFSKYDQNCTKLRMKNEKLHFCAVPLFTVHFSWLPNVVLKTGNSLFIKNVPFIKR